MSDAKTDRPETASPRPRSTEIPIETLGAIKTADLPDGFILFSEAIRRLGMSMWSGLKRPIALQKVRADFIRKERVHHPHLGFGPWQQRAGEALTLAAFEGKLDLYAAGEDQENPICTKIPAKVLRQQILRRGSLPDRAIHPTLKACDHDHALFQSLQRSLLVVKESEFSRWLKEERRKGKWSSQESRQKPRIGRPTKQRQELEEIIIAIVRNEIWSGKLPVTQLRRLLIEAGRNVPSADTLARRVDKLHDATGDPRLRRRMRAPRRVTAP
jgi:hypothetical protein